MINLGATIDVLRVVTTSTANIAVHASWIDLLGTAVTPGRTNTAIASAATTTIVAAPAASTVRNVKSLFISNTHASTANTVTLQYFDGTTAFQIFSRVLAAGEMIVYDEDGGGFTVRGANGVTLTATSIAAIGGLNTVILLADVINNNGTANTIADVTGLSFPVVSGQTYYFRFSINYTAAAATTGSRWAINGPTTTLLSYESSYTLTLTTETLNYQAGYDLPAASNISSLTTGNLAVIEGFITPSANGTVIARFASEVLSSAITAKAGSMLTWARTL